MPIKFNTESKVTGVADEDLFLDDAGEVTTDADKAAVLIVRAGQDITSEMVETYGLNKVTPEEEKAEEPKENKAEKPSKNKGAK